jgi:hypothetical protein
MPGWLSSILSIIGIGMQNTRDSELKADGLRKGEIESRDKQDEIRNDANQYRKDTANSSDGDILGKL